jgi:hypothetical protein
MPRYTGNDGTVMVGAVAVANVRTFDVQIQGDEIEMPAMGDTARVRLPGKPNVGGTITVWYDPANTTGQGALVQGAEVSLQLRPLGAGAGKPQFALSAARIISENYRVAVDAGMESEYSFTSDALPVRTAQAG